MAGTYEVALHSVQTNQFNGAYTLGQDVLFDVPCKIVSIHFNPSTITGTSNAYVHARIYNANTGILLASGSANNLAMQSGVFAEIPLTTPLTVVAGTTYRICIYAAGETHLAAATNGGAGHTHASTPAFAVVGVSSVMWATSVPGDNFPNASSYSNELILKMGLDVSNQVPNTPTDLQITSAQTDTTPTFQVSISDPDTSQQIKGRFYIYQSDGTTLITTTDSSFRAGTGVVSKEWTTGLAVGSYKVKATTVDDLGAESTATSLVSFTITQQVTKALSLLWDQKGGISKDLQVLWNIDASNIKAVSLLWDIYQQVSIDLELLWDQQTPWEPIIETPGIWEEVEL